MIVRMKGGRLAADPRLGRVPQWDPRNERFSIRTLIPQPELQRKTWRLAATDKLDQGQEGSCVGHGMAHARNAEPKRRHLTHTDAVNIYHQAQRLDQWPGEDYDGTSVLAGAKAMRARKDISTYRWALNMDDLLATVSHVSPVVMGTNWYTGQFDPDADGYLHVTGKVEGGHCWLIRGIDPARERVLMTNSWGTGWGRNGDAFLSFTDLERLFNEDAEAAIVTEV